MTTHNNDKIECISSWIGHAKDDYRHMLHIECKSENNLGSVCSSSNSISDSIHSWFKKLEKKNQTINHNNMESKLMSIKITIDKIDNNVKEISSIVDLDLKQETKETLNELANKIGTISFEGMNSLGDHKLLRLFYGTEEIMVLQQEVDYNYTEYENIKEILDYWRQLYKDPQFSVQERNEIIEKIRTTYLEYENLLTYFNYETTLFVSDDDEDNQSSTHTANIVSESKKESDNEKEEETTPLRKRKLD
jgi:hypothetical protein